MFKSTMNKGFQMLFENGYTISVQFGFSNYCENRRNLPKYNDEMKQDIVECKNCEIAIWDKDDNWLTGEILQSIGMESSEDEVCGWLTADDVAKIISHLYQL